MDIAAMYGHLEIVKWLYINKLYTIITYDTIMGAIKNDHIDVAKFLYHSDKIEYHTNNYVSFQVWYGRREFKILLEP
jgi:hypothetical protein